MITANSTDQNKRTATSTTVFLVSWKVRTLRDLEEASLFLFIAYHFEGTVAKEVLGKAKQENVLHINM